RTLGGARSGAVDSPRDNARARRRLAAHPRIPSHAPAAPPAVARAPLKPFVIEVTDADTGRPVPLVELRTTNHLRYVTDNAGVIAFDEPGLLGTEVFFSVVSHGYEVPKDGFGIRGVRLTTKPGETGKVKLKRLNIAERLHRVTGDGVFAESIKAGRE
ncbi:Uncharacterized protein APZ42_002255, partial [Daphnia magna]